MDSKDPVAVLLGQSAPAPEASRAPAPVPGTGPPDEKACFRAPRQPAGKSRRKLWHLPHRFHCALIGTCLEVDDLRTVAARLGMKDLRGETDYGVHNRFVGLAGEKNPVSQRLQGLMDRKFRATIRRFSHLQEEEELRDQWHDQWMAGHIAGAFWALATHPATTRKLADEVYGEVHMLSHQVGAGNRADRRRLAELEESHQWLTERLQQAVSKANRHHREKQKALEEAQGWRDRAREAENRLEIVEKQLREWEEGTQTRELRQHIDRLEGQLRHQISKTERAETKLAELSDPAPAPDRYREGRTPSASPSERSCPKAEQADLGGRCVLCVGGRTGLAHRYRRLVERYNGSFLHHDGGLEDGSQRLQQLLKRADRVVCPLDCVSHEATNRIKDHCKRRGVPCLLLESSGVTAFARALPQLAHREARTTN